MSTARVTDLMSQAYLKTEAFGYAISDATKAIELKPGFVKVSEPTQCVFAYSC